MRSLAASSALAFARALALALPVLSLGPMLGAAGCNTYADALTRGQRAFEESEHERALAIFRALEPDVERLSIAERAHYAYLRGMTDFRIGYKAEARHWLAVAAAIDKRTPEALPGDWEKRMNEALKDLNDLVYTGGIASLSNTPAPTDKPSGETDETDEAPRPPAAP
jgi:hypothetical protein